MLSEEWLGGYADAVAVVAKEEGDQGGIVAGVESWMEMLSQPPTRNALLDSSSYEFQERIALSLAEAVLEATTAAEGTTANGSDDGEHDGEQGPSDPAKGLEGTERVAVVVAVVTTVGADAVGHGCRAGEPEDPRHKEPDPVACNRGDDSADAGEEEGGLCG